MGNEDETIFQLLHDVRDRLDRIEERLDDVAVTGSSSGGGMVINSSRGGSRKVLAWLDAIEAKLDGLRMTDA